MPQKSSAALKLVIFMLLVALLTGGSFIAGNTLKRTTLEAAMFTDCPGGDLDLKGHGIIIESKLEDQLLRLTLERHAGKNEIITIDTCSGKVLSNLSVETDQGMVEE